MQAKSDFFFEIITNKFKNYNFLDQVTRQIIKLKYDDFVEFFEDIFITNVRKLSLQLYKSTENLNTQNLLQINDTIS